jgi:DNA-binding NtrC family response regulator
MYAEKYKKPNIQFSQNAYNQMLNYTWRGNVRELEHAIERAVLLSRGTKIESMNLMQANGTAVSGEFPSLQFTAAAAAAAGSGDSASFGGLASLPSMIDLEGEELFEEIGRFIVDRLPEPTEGADQKDVFNDIESGVVLAALKRTRGNKQAAANLLGLYRPRLYGMIKRHSLEDRV